MEPGAADGTLGIGVEPLYSFPGERMNYFAVVDAPVEVNPAVTETIIAYLTIKYETDSINPPASICGAARIKLIPCRSVSCACSFPIWLERDFAPFPVLGLRRQVTPKNPIG
jgi:hypothetical protein